MTKLFLTLNKGYYVPGELVQGAVTLEVTRKLRLRNIVLRAEGFERTQIVVSTGTGKHRHTHTYTERNTMHDYPVELLGPAELEPGRYDYPFRFQLPVQLLSTYHGTNAWVIYTVKANADIPFWFDANQSVEPLITIPHQMVQVDTQPLGVSSENVDNYAKPGFMVTFERATWFAGETLRGAITVTSLGQKKARCAELMLNMLEMATARGHSRETLILAAKTEIPGDQLVPGMAVPFSMHIPREVYSAYNGVFSSMKWLLHINLNIAWGFDTKAVQELMIFNAV